MCDTPEGRRENLVRTVPTEANGKERAERSSETSESDAAMVVARVVGGWLPCGATGEGTAIVVPALIFALAMLPDFIPVYPWTYLIKVQSLVDSNALKGPRPESCSP
jgi:hypothetical protein